MSYELSDAEKDKEVAREFRRREIEAYLARQDGDGRASRVPYCIICKDAIHPTEPTKLWNDRVCHVPCRKTVLKAWRKKAESGREIPASVAAILKEEADAAKPQHQAHPTSHMEWLEAEQERRNMDAEMERAARSMYREDQRERSDRTCHHCSEPIPMGQESYMWPTEGDKAHRMFHPRCLDAWREGRATNEMRHG